jgi:S-formylglutathione hydrolase FrmB
MNYKQYRIIDFALLLGLVNSTYKNVAVQQTPTAQSSIQNPSTSSLTSPVKNVFYSFSGNHSWSYWRQHLADSLTFVGEQFRNSARNS